MYTKQHPQSYIDTYNDCYNTSFTELTERYSLFPKGDNEYGYTKEWPNNNMPGVYFVLDQNEELLYIGQSKSLGKRLYNHFPPSSNGCTIKEGEKLKGACYLYTTSCPKEKPWERLSLEEYLINELNPPRNER